MYSSIQDYLSEGAKTDYDQLVKRFGAPSKVGYTYVTEMETDEIIENIRNGKKLIKIVSVTAIIIGMVWLGYLALCICEANNTMNGYMAIGDAVIIDKTEISEGGR